MPLKPKSPPFEVSESVIKRHCMQYLTMQKEFFGWVEVSTGIYDPTRQVFRKRSGFGMINGVSDIVGMWKGRGLACEIKTPKGKLSDVQKLFLMRYQERGGISSVLRSIDDCVELVSTLRCVNLGSDKISLPEKFTKDFL